MKNMKQNSV